MIEWRRRDPKTWELRNTPEVPQAFQSGTGASPNPLRPEPERTEPTAGSHRLGEPDTPVNRLGTDRRPEQAYSTIADAYISRADELAEQDREPAERGDEAAGNRRAMYDDWKALFDRMPPDEQAREIARQDQFADRQQRMDDYLREHEDHFRVDDEGAIQGSDVSDEESRRLKILMRQRDRAVRQIDRGQRPHIQGRPQGMMRRTGR